MADGLPTIDTSSYPRPTPGPSALDTFGKLQGLEQQHTQIEQSKLDLVNKRYGIVSKELQGLIGDPEVDFNKIAQRTQNLVNLGLMPAEMMTQFLKDAPTDKKAIPQYLQMKLQQSQDIMSAINYGQGAPTTFTDQNRTYQGVVSPKPGIGVRINPNPIMDTKIGNQEVPDTNPTLPDGSPNPNYGQKRFNLPANGPLVAPQQPQTLPVGPVNNPAIRGPSANFGGNVTGAEVGPVENPRLPIQPSARVAQGFPSGPQGPASSMSPMYEEGRKAYTQDQELATQKLSQIRPALQALPLLKDMNTGPLTDQINKIKATAKALGIVDTIPNDPVAARQIINKKLAQYVAQSPLSGRSDAGQALAQASNPDPNGQINQALTKLVKDGVILDRVDAARAGSFANKQGDKLVPRKDYDAYVDHRAKFPPSIDERAFGIDLMEPKERQDLLDTMKKKANTFEGKKFWKSLGIVKDQGLIDIGG